MSRRLAFDVRALALGAGVALAIAIPTSLLSQALDATDHIADDSAVVYVAAAIIIAGLAVGGAVAAARQPSAPLRHGAAAALIAFVVVSAIGMLRRSIANEDMRWGVVAINAVVAMWAGSMGALVSELRLSWRERRRGQV